MLPVHSTTDSVSFCHLAAEGTEAEDSLSASMQDSIYLDFSCGSRRWSENLFLDQQRADLLKPNSGKQNIFLSFKEETCITLGGKPICYEHWQGCKGRAGQLRSLPNSSSVWLHDDSRVICWMVVWYMWTVVRILRRAHRLCPNLTWPHSPPAQWNTNLGIAVQRFCRWNEEPRDHRADCQENQSQS